MFKEAFGKEWPIPSLQGENLLLRPCCISDFDAIKAYRQDEASCQYIRPPESDEQIRTLVEQHCSPWELSEGRWNGLVVTEVENDKALGEIVFRIEDEVNLRAEIGYRIAPQAGGKGLATKGCRLLIDYLFAELGLFKVVAKCDPRNTASYRVMEKLGMVREAHFKKHFKIGERWTDQYDYGLLKEDWKSR
ncbi:GNAT family N-acetyltransferase [Aliikangiella sp. G2MR2-5]|uniref:GNAT family N-acetyltransferase n=1 Tax=Aliikangiella sp. G2MR2-5 TaxID=2788943 RepID=UPI0018AC2B45|nr:GNAT family protein [Aliikangiella sp. G2MR2-5]